MVFPWKVVGFEKWTNDSGEDCVRLYVARDFNPENGAGLETQRLYYKTKYVQYEPVIGHMIIAQDGRYGVQNIVVVGGYES